MPQRAEQGKLGHYRLLIELTTPTRTVFTAEETLIGCAL